MSNVTDAAGPPESAAGRDDSVDDGLRGFLRLFWASLYKQFLILVRYPVNTLSQFGTILLVFVVLFFGGRAVAPAAINDTLSGLIVGYLLWSMSIAAFGGLSWGVTREAQWGTLEQLFMSPFGFGPVMTVRTVVDVLESFLWGALTLLVAMVLTGRWLALDPVTVLPLLVLAIAPAVGIGFVFGGLAIRFKRIENAFQLVQFVLVGVIAAPVDRYPFLQWLPLTQGSYLLRRAMADGVSIWEMPPGELGVLVVVAVGYLAIGYGVFHYCQRWARRQGVMGHY